MAFGIVQGRYIERIKYEHRETWAADTEIRGIRSDEGEVLEAAETDVTGRAVTRNKPMSRKGEMMFK